MILTSAEIVRRAPSQGSDRRPVVVLVRGAAALTTLLLAAAAAAQCPAGDAPLCAPSGTVGDFPRADLALDVTPVGNGSPTRSAFAIAGTTNATSEREFLVALGLNSVTGAASDPPTTPFHDKVTLYTAITGNRGTGDIWAMNPLVTQESGSGDYTAQGVELDFNNMNAHRGDADAGAGLAPPNSYGLSVTGAGRFRSTSAFLVAGPGHPIWNRGMVFANDAVAQSTFQDLMSGHNKSIDIRGQPTWGIYQSNSATKNYFAGKTGLGVRLGSEAGGGDDGDHARRHDGAQVVVGGGDLLVVENTVTVQHGVTKKAAVLGHSDAQELVHSGNVVLGPAATATVLLPRAAQAYWDAAFGVGTAASVDLSDMTHVYALTAVGAPAPHLHVARELAREASGGAISFTVAGGPPGLKVSWTLRSRREQTIPG